MVMSCRSASSGSSFLSVTVSENTDTDYLSIGEVLGLLLEEFPDVTISKIRFLESQGLIDPERTASGYRKFYEADVELLRVILREQRENYLPLRVIKDRINSGEIDPSGELRRDLMATSESASGPSSGAALGYVAPGDPIPERRSERSQTVAAPVAVSSAGQDHTPVTPQLLPGVVLSRQELCALVGLDADSCEELEQFGILSGRGSGEDRLFDEDAVQIGRLAAQFLAAGVDARHLRGWMTSADREASLYEQLITPRLRQRSPQARAEALEQLQHLEALGAKMRTAMMRRALAHHFDH